MKFFHAFLFIANLFACRPEPNILATSQILTGERAGNFTILDASSFNEQPQKWSITDKTADILFVFEPSKKTLEVNSVRFQFFDFGKCAIWLGPYSTEMAAAQTSLDPHFPIIPPPAPFLDECEQDGLKFLATPTEVATDRLVFHLSEDFWEAWETGCLDWPWSVHFRFFAKE